MNMMATTRSGWVTRATLWYADCFHYDMPAANRAANALADKLGAELLRHVPEDAVSEHEDGDETP